MCNDITKLLENNKKWVQQSLDKDSVFFNKLAQQHNPKFLWIGCSDARIFVNSITGMNAGEIFVHRNVGNIVSDADKNITAVIAYAVENLGIKNIIVAGHYDCGAIKAGLSDESFGNVDDWIKNIKQVISQNEAELSLLSGLEKQKKLCELNVKSQINNLAKTPIIKQAWTDNKDIVIHGWIYDIATGLLKELETITNA